MEDIRLEVDGLWDRLHMLWDRLTIPQDERSSFTEGKEGFKPKVISAVSVVDLFIFIIFVNPVTPTVLYGMLQIKTWTIPLYILRVERVNTTYTCYIPLIYTVQYSNQ